MDGGIHFSTARIHDINQTLTEYMTAIFQVSAVFKKSVFVSFLALLGLF